jgi:[acyl-carrier-protein] S-malonyltransferase
MGKDLSEAFPEAKHTFEEIDDALSQNLSKLMFEGPESDLNLTENTQPALMATSMAVVNVITKQGGINLSEKASFVAGHSLGEYSALTAAEAFDISTTAKLLKIRGQAMQEAVPVGVGSMAAILGMDLSDVKDIAAEASNTETCEAANDNSVGQIVISGHKRAVEAAIALATDRGAKKAIPLPVSAPFHCTLMAPAADKMAEALENVEINRPLLPVVANVTAQEVSDPSEIKRLLVEQITGMVRWRESVIWMKNSGVEEMIELGAGKVLSGLVRRIDRDIAVSSAGNPEQVEELIRKLES